MLTGLKQSGKLSRMLLGGRVWGRKRERDKGSYKHPRYWQNIKSYILRISNNHPLPCKKYSIAPNITISLESDTAQQPLSLHTYPLPHTVSVGQQLGLEDGDDGEHHHWVGEEQTQTQTGLHHNGKVQVLAWNSIHGTISKKFRSSSSTKHTSLGAILPSKCMWNGIQHTITTLWRNTQTIQYLVQIDKISLTKGAWLKSNYALVDKEFIL